MKRRKTISGRQSERGVVILLVAVVLLFIVVAMAALAIDLTTFYSARSEAQIAADGAALAGARVLANSGTTSNPVDADLASNTEDLARMIAIQVGTSNPVGGRNLSGGGQCPGAEVCVSFSNVGGGTGYNPQISVRVTRTDLPTFFARIWGSSTITVSATATAEAYNPSGIPESTGSVPIAPTCVKPWLLPNLYTDAGGALLFDPDTGAIQPTAFLGRSVPFGSNSTTGGLYTTCGSPTTPPCNSVKPYPPAKAWQYFPAAPSSFPTPTQALPACSAGFSDYQLSIAGCVQTPIVCGRNGNVDLDIGFSDPGGTPDSTAAAAVNCLTHSQNDRGDSMLMTAPNVPSQPFQFLAGADNPVVKPAGSNVIVSDSLVTVPVVYLPLGDWRTAPPVKVIGFVQLFLNPTGMAAVGMPANFGPGLPAKIVNLVGCGTDAFGQPILGNGPSAVPVRLITP